MTRHLRTCVSIGALLVLAAVGAVSCAYADPPVMTIAIDGKAEPFFTMTQADLEKKLDEGSSAAGASTTTAPAYYQAAQVASILTSELRKQVIGELIKSRHITTTDADKTQAQIQMAQAGGSATQQPDDFQVKLVALQRSLAESAFASGQVDKQDRARKHYEENKGAYESPAQLCLHYIQMAPESALAGGSVTPEELQAVQAQAATVKARIGAETFEAVADSVNPAEVRQGSPGGDLGCVTKPSGISAADWAAIGALPIGVVSDPMTIAEQVVFIFRLEENRPARVPSFEDVRTRVEQDVTFNIGEQLLTKFLTDTATNLVVTVDPRYGRWVPEQIGIEPPEGAAQPTVPTTTSSTEPLFMPTPSAPDGSVPSNAP